MHVEIRQDAEAAVRAAADLLGLWIQDPAVRCLMVAGGNTPLPLYEAVARKNPTVAHLRISVLDEYVGVPNTHPRNCTNLLRRTVAQAWRVPPKNFFGLSSEVSDAETALLEHERRIHAEGGLDAIVLGLGRNGHLGFNEPGSAAESAARILDLDPVSTNANRDWFAGEFAPARGATVGLRTILGARRVLILALGEAKAQAVQKMLGPPDASCPASFLQDHPNAHFFLDSPAAARIA